MAGSTQTPSSPNSKPVTRTSLEGRVARRARRDLIEIGDYLERVASRAAALRWVMRLGVRALKLAVQPYASAEDPDLGGRRRMVARPYVIVYRIASPDFVRIVRIVHGARDLPQLFAFAADD